MAEYSTEDTSTRAISVRGMGIIHVPKDYTDEQILELVRQHPDYEKALAEPEPKTKTQKAIDNTLGFANEVPKGLPLVGNYIPRSEVNKTFAREHPNYAVGARVGGAVAGSLPIYRALGGVAGGGLAAETAANTAIGGALGVGDELARQHSKGEPWNTSKALTQGGYGAGTGFFGPFIGHMITPTTLRSLTPRDATNAANRGAMSLNSSNVRQVGGEDVVDAARRGISQTPTVNPPPPWVRDMSTNIGMGTAGGGALAHYLGMDPHVGMELGAAFGLTAPRMRDALLRSPWGTNRILSAPASRDVINALLATIPNSHRPPKMEDLQLLK